MANSVDPDQTAPIPKLKSIIVLLNAFSVLNDFSTWQSLSV